MPNIRINDETKNQFDTAHHEYQAKYGKTTQAEFVTYLLNRVSYLLTYAEEYENCFGHKLFGSHKEALQYWDKLQKEKYPNDKMWYKIEEMEMNS